MSKINSQPDNQAAWDNQMSEVNKITDALGLPIDEGIKDTVCVLMLHKFPTTASCEGHLSKNDTKVHGSPFPWIEICTEEPEGFSEASEDEISKLGNEWLKANLKEQKRLIYLLKEFYKNRETEYEVRLGFDNYGWGVIRLQSVGASLSQIQTPEEAASWYLKYKKEMNDFTEFLKQKISY